MLDKKKKKSPKKEKICKFIQSKEKVYIQRYAKICKEEKEEPRQGLVHDIRCKERKYMPSPRQKSRKGLSKEEKAGKCICKSAPFSAFLYARQMNKKKENTCKRKGLEARMARKERKCLTKEKAGKGLDKGKFSTLKPISGPKERKCKVNEVERVKLSKFST